MKITTEQELRARNVKGGRIMRASSMFNQMIANRLRKTLGKTIAATEYAIKKALKHGEKCGSCSKEMFFAILINPDTMIISSHCHLCEQKHEIMQVEEEDLDQPEGIFNGEILPRILKRMEETSGQVPFSTPDQPDPTDEIPSKSPEPEPPTEKVEPKVSEPAAEPATKETVTPPPPPATETVTPPADKPPEPIMGPDPKFDVPKDLGVHPDGSSRKRAKRRTPEELKRDGQRSRSKAD